jgi:hypothetical protein
MKKLLLTFLIGITLTGFGQNLVHHFTMKKVSVSGINVVYEDKAANNDLGTIHSNGNSQAPPTTLNGIQDSLGDESIHLRATGTAVRLKSANPTDNTSWTGAAYSVWVRNCIDGIIIQFPYGGYGLRASANGKIQASFDGYSATQLSTTQPLNDGLWHHIVAQNDGSTTYIYVDGVLDTSDADPLYIPSSLNQSATLTVGANRFSNQRLTGQIDELKMFDDILSQAQIDSLYNEVRQGAQLYKEFEYNFNGTFEDSSLNQLNLQNNNGNRFTFAQGRSSSSGDSSIYAGASNASLSTTSPLPNMNWSSTAISLWMKECTDGRVLLAYGLGFGISVNTSGIISTYFDGSGAGALNSSNVAPTHLDTNWHHVVAQNDGDTTYLYIDGTLDAKQAESYFVRSTYSPLYIVLIGSGMYLNGSTPVLYQYLQDGYLDDVNIYSRSLTQIEINELFQFGMITGEKELPQLQVQEFNIYPNPASDFINLPKEVYNADEIKVFNMNGQVVKRSSRVQSLSISELESGMYFLYVSKGEQIFRSKFLKH